MLSKFRRIIGQLDLKVEQNRKTVEILVFGVYENPLLLREVHTLGRTTLIMFLDRRNCENS